MGSGLPTNMYVYRLLSYFIGAYIAIQGFCLGVTCLKWTTLMVSVLPAHTALHITYWCSSTKALRPETP